MRSLDPPFNSQSRLNPCVYESATFAKYPETPTEFDDYDFDLDIYDVGPLPATCRMSSSSQPL